LLFQTGETFAVARAPRDFRLTIAVKPGFVAVDSGHKLLLLGEFSIAKAQCVGRIFEVKS